MAKVVVILLFMFIMGASGLYAQTGSETAPADTVPKSETQAENALNDSLEAIELADTLMLEKRNPDAIIGSKITYSASDSIDNDVQNKKVYLYGNAQINYEDIILKAHLIIYDFGTYTVHAEGMVDSLGQDIGAPVFKQGTSDFKSKEMDYNFRSKKAYVKQVQTEIVEGTLTGKQVKTTENNRVIYIKNGEYCPCEDPNAKTRFKIGKLKVIKDDRIVSGPGYLALGKIPTPLAFPFGFFPNSEKKQAGLIIPSYGNGDRQGYFLNDIGFYLPLGDNFDTRILADIYTRGSWGIENQTRYTQRYKFDGNVGFQYNSLVSGDRDLNNFSKSTSFFVNWNHNQDSRAKPLSNFSANVNAGSTQNFSNNLNASQQDYLTNTFRSNIRYSKSFYDSPWNMSLNAGHDQNSRTGNYRFTLPEIGIQRSRTMPLDGLFDSNPRQAFYEKLGLTYSANIRNELQVTEEELALNNWPDLKKKFNNGMQHNIALSLPLNAGPISITPSFNYNERWYLRTYGRSLDEDLGTFVQDTINGFDRNFNYSASVSATTKLYGMYGFTGGKLKAIRHTMTPTIGYGFTPDFDPNIYGFYGDDGRLSPYSPYTGTIYGGPPSGRSESLNFTLVNNVEAKLIARNDTVSKFKKVQVIENITASTSYNFAADSLKLSNINLTARTPVTKYLNLNLSAQFDPYIHVVTETGQVTNADLLLWERERKIANFENGTFALNSSGIGSSMFKKNKKPAKVIEEGEEPLTVPIVKRDKGLFEDFTIPWNVRFGYSLRARNIRQSVQLDEGFAIDDSIAYIQSLTFSGDFELFDRVRVNFTSGYDFIQKELTPTNIFVVVDLNCWEFSANVVPFGDRRSYRLALNIKSSLLRDLKLERNRNFGDDGGFFL